MPKQYMLHAMGVKNGLRLKKRGLAQLLSSVIPVRHLKITGQGAQRRVHESERQSGSGSMVIKKGLTPTDLNFNLFYCFDFIKTIK